MTDAPKAKPSRELTRETFEALLLALDADRAGAAERYERIRGRLIRFFGWEGSPAPEDHADEAINRVARRIASGEDVRDIERYFHGVCQLMLKEIAVQRLRRDRALDQVQEQVRAPEPRREDDSIPSECLESCLIGLTPDQRDLILRYYQGDRSARIQNRKRLAAELALPMNALRNRALRIRDRLEGCMEECRVARRGERDTSSEKLTSIQERR